jgi:short-subunit dehydrogenase
MAEQTGRPRALITGASSGLGLAFAERLAADGYDLTIVARRRDRLDALATRLRTKGGEVEVLLADLADRTALRTIEARLTADAPALLVNNAGFGGYGPFIDIDPDLLDQQIAVHITALTHLARAALPGMVARGSGVIINVSSSFAFSASVKMPTRKRANYAATKAFINTFTELLSHELEGTGVKVQALCPGVVRTEFHDHVGGRPEGVPVFDPADVVAASLAGLALGEVVCVPQLPDLSALEGLAAAQRTLWGQARSDTVAARYKATPA